MLTKNDLKEIENSSSFISSDALDLLDNKIYKLKEKIEDIAEMKATLRKNFDNKWNKPVVERIDIIEAMKEIINE